MQIGVPFSPRQEMLSDSPELLYCVDKTPPKVTLHTHSHYELYFLCEGDIQGYVVGDKIYYLQTGDILLIPPGILHHPIFSSKQVPYCRYVLWVSKNFLASVSQIDPDIDFCFRLCHERGEYLIRNSIAVSQKVLNTLQEICFEAQSGALCTSLAEMTETIGLLIYLNRSISTQNIISNRSAGKSPLLNTVIKYIHANYHDHISLTDTASKFFVSPSTIAHIFSRHLGRSFYQYLMECRIIAAKKSIRDGAPMKLVCKSCGFSDYSNFYKAFSKQVGMSPSEYKTYCECDNPSVSQIESQEG